MWSISTKWSRFQLQLKLQHDRRRRCNGAKPNSSGWKFCCFYWRSDWVMPVMRVRLPAIKTRLKSLVIFFVTPVLETWSKSIAMFLNLSKGDQLWFILSQQWKFTVRRICLILIQQPFCRLRSSFASKCILIKKWTGKLSYISDYPKTMVKQLK